MRKIDPQWALAVLLLAVLITLQAVTMHGQADLRRSVEALAARPSNNGPIFSFPYGSLKGYNSFDLQVDPTSFRNGDVTAIVRSELMAKTPGSIVLLKYRLSGDDRWRQVPMTQGDPLQYAVILPVRATDKVEYQQLQIVRNEVVQASEVRTTDMLDVVGTGDVSVYYTQMQGASDITFNFESRALVEALQVAEIALKVDKTKPEQIVLSSYPWTCTFSNDGFNNMEVTVKYKDGTVRTATYDFMSPNPLIKR